MLRLTGSELRCLCRRAAAGRHSKQATLLDRRGKQNRVVRAPGPAVHRTSGTQRLHDTIRYRHFLELAIGEEADPRAVRREERTDATVGARQCNGARTIESSEIQASRAVDDGAIDN